MSTLPVREPLIRVEHVTFAYDQSAGTAPALDGVSLDVNAGEILALIGRNGSGKTTLAKHLNGLLKPEQGRVTVLGSDTRDARVGDLARHVGYVFQNPDHALFLPSVREEIAYGPARLGLPHDEVERRVADALERFQLARYADHHPAALGRGLRRLTVLAATYAMDPAVLVLDEPTGGLDHRLEAQLMDVLVELAEDDRAIILITHEMRLVARFAGRAVLMSDGRILADRAPGRLFDDTDVLERAGLQPPPITRLASELAGSGFPGEVGTVDQFVAAFERLMTRAEAER